VVVRAVAGGTVASRELGGPVALRELGGSVALRELGGSVALRELGVAGCRRATLGNTADTAWQYWVLQGIPGNAARILRKKYASS